MDCFENQYYESGGCHSCVQCSPGQELTEDCGYGYGALARCQPCGARWFKEAWGSHPCQMCQACRHVNRSELLPCTPTTNAMCGECLPGFYSKRRLDGQQDLECMSCGPPPFRNPLCGTFAASRGVDVEKVSSPVATPTTFTTAATTSACVAVVAMMLLLSATMFMYRRSTLLRRFFKGCLIPHSCSHDDTEAPSATAETQCTLTQEEEEQISGMIPRQTTSDKRSANNEEDCCLPAMPAVLSDPGVCESCTLRQSVSSDCSSGFASQPSSGLPTPLPTSRDLAAPALATGGHHCASEEGSGWMQRRRHVPVECTELDIHDSFHPELDSDDLFPPDTELHTSKGPGLGPGDDEPSLDLYSSVPSNISLELHVCSETGRPSTEEPRPLDVRQVREGRRDERDVEMDRTVVPAVAMPNIFNLVQRSCAIMQGVPLSDLPKLLVHSLAQRLDPVFPGVQSYQQVARCLGVPAEIARGLQGFEHVFHYLSSCTLLTVPDLLTTLHQLQRLDTLVLLCEHCTLSLNADTGHPCAVV